MRAIRIFSLVALVAICLPSLAADKGKKGKNKPANAAAVVQDNVLVADLQAAFAVIDRAEPIYHGHRGKAKHQINEAIELLQKEMHKHGLKAHHKPSEKETRAESDALIGQGMKAVTTTLTQLNGLPDSKHRSAAKVHLAKAIEELKASLVVSKEDQAKKAKQ
jgi:hypothetical protein